MNKDPWEYFLEHVFGNHYKHVFENHYKRYQKSIADAKKEYKSNIKIRKQLRKGLIELKWRVDEQ